MRPVALLAGLAFTLTACATYVNSTSQFVLIVTDPPEAEVWIDDRWRLRSPGKVTLSRLGDHMVVVEKDGYESKAVTIKRGHSKWVYLDFFCLVFMYSCIKSDMEDGGYYAFDDEIIIRLNKKP
jgi:ABC-type uncharacterized transport system auxiliary subunit